MRFLPASLLFALTACSSTYYDPMDPYARGVRYFDRRDFAEAQRLWEPLAANGDCDAQYRLGTLYFLGAGVPQDYERARQHWTVAANQGQAFAQALLATMHAHDAMAIQTVQMTAWYNCKAGCGLPKDPAAAYQWMRLAERHTPYDKAPARANVDKYAGLLSAEERAQADARVEAWKPTPKQCAQRTWR